MTITGETEQKQEHQGGLYIRDDPVRREREVSYGDFIIVDGGPGGDSCCGGSAAAAVHEEIAEDICIYVVAPGACEAALPGDTGEPVRLPALRGRGQCLGGTETMGVSRRKPEGQGLDFGSAGGGSQWGTGHGRWLGKWLAREIPWGILAAR